MSRWGVAAIAAAAAVVLAIGITAVRISDRSTTTQTSTTAEPAEPTPDAASARTVPQRERVTRDRDRPESVRAQLRWLKRRLPHAESTESFYVTVSLRRPLPLTIAKRRGSPLPKGLPGSTEYSLYAEPGDGTMYKARTADLDQTASLRVPTETLRDRLVVLGMSMPVDEYRGARSGLRSLPIGARVVDTRPLRAEYLPGRIFDRRALRSWGRYYRRS